MKHSKHVRGTKLKVNLEKGFNEIKRQPEVVDGGEWEMYTEKPGKKETSTCRKLHTHCTKYGKRFYDLELIYSAAISEDSNRVNSSQRPICFFGFPYSM